MDAGCGSVKQLLSSEVRHDVESDAFVRSLGWPLMQHELPLPLPSRPALIIRGKVAATSGESPGLACKKAEFAGEIRKLFGQVG